MRVTVNFYLKKTKSRVDEKCAVYVRCTMNNQRFELSTGIFVLPEFWNDEKQQVKGRTEETKILNNRLNKISNRAYNVCSQKESIRSSIISIMDVKNPLLILKIALTITAKTSNLGEKGEIQIYPV